MKYILFTFLTVAAAVIFVCDAAAQRNPPGLECPGTRVLTSAEVVTDGDQVTFHSELTGGNIDRSILKYYWTIDRGRIVDGQNTPVIVVDTTGQGAAGSVTVTLQISPYPDCEWVVSETTRVRRKGRLTKADKFWEWFWLNSSRIYYRDSLFQNGQPDALDDLRDRLSKVDPSFTVQIPARKEYQYHAQMIIGWAGKVYDAKKVDAFIARAPIMSGWTISSAKQGR